MKMSDTERDKILFLGDSTSPLIQWLQEQGEDIVHSSDKVTVEFLAWNKVSFLVSYGYRHIVNADVITYLQGRAINLHISYLPWNRGADPNFWSFVEATPKGVTIHYIDAGIDTGDIIAQKAILLNPEKETFASSYEKLQSEIQELFKANWTSVKKCECDRRKQTGKGSFHRVKDKEPFLGLLVSGWDTPISQVMYQLLTITEQDVKES